MIFCYFKPLISHLKIAFSPFWSQPTYFPDWKRLTVLIPEMCLAQGPKRCDAGEASRSRVKHSTTEPLRSLCLHLLFLSNVLIWIQTPSVTSDLVLNCLLMSNQKDTWPKWVNNKYFDKKSKQIVPDQISPLGAVWYGTILFAHAFPVKCSDSTDLGPNCLQRLAADNESGG